MVKNVLLKVFIHFITISLSVYQGVDLIHDINDALLELGGILTIKLWLTEVFEYLYRCFTFAHHLDDFFNQESR